MPKLNLTVVIEKDPGTGLYVGVVLGIPGAHSQGATIDELMENMKEVTELCLEARKPEKVPVFIGVQRLEVTA